jgi:pyrroline-5-carboxylate reductase
MAEGVTGVTGVIGVIGVGEIAEAMVTGLLSEDAGAPAHVILSPRSATRATALATRFDAVTVAVSNAGVAVSADVVIVSVRPDQLADALDGVVFRPDQLVISTLAGVDLATLRDAVGGSDEGGPAIVRSVPLPPVARRAGVTPVIPAEARAVQLFDLLGGYLAVADEEQMAAVTVLTGAQTGLLQYIAELCQWAADNGLEPGATEMFIRSTVAGLEPGLRDATTPIAGLIDNFETEGGLNWQLRTRFFDAATSTSLIRELDSLHERVRGE